MKDNSNKMWSLARACIIGFVLIPVNCYWLIQMEEVRRASGATVFSLFFTAIFTLWLLVLLNGGLRRFAPKLAFDNRELLTVYIMVNMSTALCSLGMLSIVVAVITYAFWGATPENEWRALFHRDLPRWLVVDEPSVLTAYYRGEASLYTAQHLDAWLPPLLWWSLFTFVLLLVMLCINVIVRRQWIEHEKLAYPIAEIPLRLVEPGGNHRLLWIGFAIAAGINIINGIHFLYPSVPGVTFFKFQHIGYIFTEKPWSALRAMRISFMPSIIGISFFMPLDVLFSCWFFYFYWQAWRIVGAIIGWRTYPAYDRFAYIVQESVGAYFAILVIAIWRGRRHFGRTLQSALTGNRSAEGDNPSPSYRIAWMGVIGGSTMLIFFCHRAGMSINIATFFILFYFGLSIAITRLRAEFGFPAHDVHYGGPVQMITDSLGTANLSQQTRVALPLFWYISRWYLSHIMPHQLEGLKIAQRSRMSQSRAFWSIVLGCSFGIVVTFWLLLHVGFKLGLDNIPMSLYWGIEPWRYLEKWMRAPTETDYHHIALIGLGVIVASFLSFMRTRFLWWPLHPMGYAVAGSYGMSFVWSCTLVSWLLKWLILRHGGIRRYRQAIPLFLGLILGEFIIAAIWSIVGISFNWPRIYQFYYN